MSRYNPSIKKLLSLVPALLFLTHCSITFAQHPKESLHFGAIFSLTDFGAEAGQGELKALELAISEINQSGGINGQQIKLHSEDNRSKQVETATAFRKLLSINKISVLFGPNWAEFAEVAAPLAQQNKIPMITASAFKENLAKNRNFVFTLFPSHRETIKPFVKYLLSKPHSKIALFSTENAFYEEISNALRHELKAHGVDIWNHFTYQSKDQDFRSAILKSRTAGADAIVAFLLHGGAPRSFLRQAEVAQFPKNRIYFGPSLAMDHTILENKSLANGVAFFTPKSNPSRQFLSKYLAHAGVLATQNEAKAYDSVYLVKEAIEKCGSDRAKIASCLSSTSYSGASGLIKFDNEGQAKASSTTSGTVFLVENGEFKKIF